MDESPRVKFLVFAVEDMRYALPSAIINEVALLEKIFPLPLVPSYIKGIINRYSVPYALIDIGRLLSKEAKTASKVIVLKEEIDKLAFLIDDVLDILDIPSESLMKTDPDENSVAGSVNASFEWKDSQVFCLDTDELFRRIKDDFNQL